MTNEELAETVREAIKDALPTKDEILEAIKEGTRLALDQCWASQILGAISEGTRDAFIETASKKR